MSTNKPPKSEPEVHVHDVSKLRGHLKIVGGSMSDDWNNLVANQTSRTLWFFADSDPEEIRRERHAAVDALMGIKPGDELEGMIAAQLIACHNASMECYRRAMIRDQSFEGRREALCEFRSQSGCFLLLVRADKPPQIDGAVLNRDGEHHRPPWLRSQPRHHLLAQLGIIHGHKGRELFGRARQCLQNICASDDADELVPLDDGYALDSVALQHRGDLAERAGRHYLLWGDPIRHRQQPRFPLLISRRPHHI